MPLRTPLPPQPAPGPLLREVVDEDDRPFCLLPEATLLRQGLRHRAVALILRDTQGRMLLTPGVAGWDFSSRALPQAMEAAEDCCRRLLETEWRLTGLAPRILRRVEACADTGMAFLTLFTARVAAASAQELAAPGVLTPEGLPLLDDIELAALAEQEPPILAPLLRHAVRAGWLAEPRMAN